MTQHRPSGVGIKRLSWAAAMAVPWAASAQVAAPPATLPAGATDPAAAVVPAAPPIVTEIESDLQQKQYGPAIRAANKALGLRGTAADGVSRFQVLMLRGDGQFASRAIPAARASYHDALLATHDPHEQAVARWTIELIRRAHGTTYVPHATAGTAAPAPIDLRDPDGRRAAFSALLDDELSMIGPQVKQAAAASNLPTILPVVQQVQSLMELDLIANGSDTRTSTTAGSLLDHARTLMATALKGMWTRVNDIHTAAVAPVTGAGAPVLVNGLPVEQTVNGVNGLTTQNQAELRDTIALSGRIRDAAATFATAAASGGTNQDWGTVENDATRVAGRASDVLNANYSSTSVTTQYPDGYGNTGLGGTVIGGGYAGGNTYYPPGGTGGVNGTFPSGPTGGPVYGGQQRSGGGVMPSHPSATPTTPPAGTKP